MTDVYMQVAQLNVPYILMHMRGTPQTMQQLTQYEDTCRDVGKEMQQQAQKAINAGIKPWRIILDPGELYLSYQQESDLIRLPTNRTSPAYIIVVAMLIAKV